MIEWNWLKTTEKDRIIKEYMRQEEEQDFKVFARKKEGIAFSSNDDIELYLYDFDENRERDERLIKLYNALMESGNNEEEKTINKPAAKKKKTSEMNDEELKEYYKRQSEERERRKRIQEEIKAEEERKRNKEYQERMEILRQEQIQYTRNNKEKLIREQEKEIKKSVLWFIWFILVFVFLFSVIPNIGTGIVVGGIILVFGYMLKRDIDFYNSKIDRIKRT